MRVNFEVNTHLAGEICEDNKKRVNIFLQCTRICRNYLTAHLVTVVQLY